MTALAPPPYYGNEFENDNSSSQPVQLEASSNLEDHQNGHLNSHANGLKQASTSHAPSALSYPETDSIRSMSTFSAATGFSEVDKKPLIGSDISKMKSPKSTRRTRFLGRMRGGSNPGPTSPVDQGAGDFPLPGISEGEAPRSSPETRQAAQQRLWDIERSDPSNSSKSFLTGLRKRNQSGSQFSLSILAAGLEAAAKEGSHLIVEALFEFGADANFSIKGSKPTRHRALEFAATAGHPIIIDYIIRRGADSTAINSALVHALVAGKADIATHLIMNHNPDVDFGTFLQRANPNYGSFAHTGYRAQCEYLNVLSAASNIAEKEERLRFIELLLSKNCDVNAYIWTVFKLKESIGPKGLTPEEMENESHFGVPKIVQDGLGYSPLARFAPICAESVKTLLQGMHLQVTSCFLKLFPCNGLTSGRSWCTGLHHASESVTRNNKWL